MPEKLTNKGLLEHAESLLALPTSYMWGTLARKIDKGTIDWCRKTYPNMYDDNRIAYLTSQIGKRYACDCVGLMKSYYFGGIGSPQYDAAKDFNTNAMYAASSKKDTLSTLPEVPGTCLYMRGHVGIYSGKGGAIECTLGKYGDGVVRSEVAGRGWTHWFYCPFVEYPQDAPAASLPESKPAPILQKGDKVQIKRDAKTFTGGNMAAYVYDMIYNVIEVAGERVVVGKGKIATAAVRRTDLVKI